ncbi:hypothetical protein D3C71_1766280 [compost metagenome]
MPDLGSQFTIGLPPQRHGLKAEQGLGDVAMRGTRLQAIERLQGAKMQQCRTGDGTRRRLSRCIALKGLRLRGECIELAAQPRAERSGDGISRPVGEVGRQ